jgi:hypothetical protein
MEETQDPQVIVEKNDAPVENEKKNILFGTISYADDSAYENFIQKMDLGQALFVLIASANFSQAKGAFNILESEVLSSAIRTIKKNSAQPAEEK